MTGARVGNPEYVRSNGSYGLATLRDEHARVTTRSVSLRFRGKGGKEQAIDIRDPRLARVVRRSRDLPGYELFQYVGDDGDAHPIDAADVNEYIHAVAGEAFTAKDFRTWWGTVLAAMTLREAGEAASRRDATPRVVGAVEQVAAALGNTPAVCRKSYIHPAILDGYLEGQALDWSLRTRSRWLADEEAAVLHALRSARERAAA